MCRDIAVIVLEDILYRTQSFERAFHNCISGRKLADRDKAFAYQVILTTLRRLGQIDNIIEHCLERPLPNKASGAKTILRIGVSQLLFLNVPPHAAVNTSVDLAHTRKLGPYKNMINAVLRRVEREGSRIIGSHDVAKLNTPQWLWDSWITTYGKDICYRIANAHLSQPPLDLTVKEDPVSWARRVSGKVIPTDSIRVSKFTMVNRIPGYKEGAWWVQDVAASLPVKLLGIIKGKRVVDLCAAPGGKTAQLVAAGANVIAVDKSIRRVKQLKENLSRLKFDADIVVADAINWRPSEALDAALVDVPCTATGIIRRHPDVQQLKTHLDIKEVVSIQRELLNTAIQSVKVGGTIIYSNCSLQPEEGPNLVASFLNSGAPVNRIPILPEEISNLEELLTPEGDIRTLPCHMTKIGGMDGFYISRLIRI